MKTNYWNTRKYTSSYTDEYKFSISWLFSTGWGDTKRYIASLRVRVPMRYQGSDSYIQFDEFPLGDSNGSTYFLARRLPLMVTTMVTFGQISADCPRSIRRKYLHMACL